MADSGTTKLVLLDPLYKMRSDYSNLMAAPPQGYAFQVSASALDHAITAATKAQALIYKLWWVMGPYIPTTMIRSWLEQFQRPPQNVALIYSVLHPIFYRRPWVLDMITERLPVLVGGNNFQRPFRKLMVRNLSSPYCRKIICWVEEGKRHLLASLGAPELEEKVEVVYWGVPAKQFHKTYNRDKVKLLFVGTANIPQAVGFYLKGGLELVEAFLELNRRYDNLELVLRSSIPERVKNRLASLGNVRVLDKPLPWSELEEEYKTADIFVQPGRVTPSSVFPEAMSYGLPVVTTDVWANGEQVEDGKTGLLVHDPWAEVYHKGNIGYYDTLAKRFGQLNAGVAKGLVEKLSILIERPELRERLGVQARIEVEEGKFSVRRRNDQLKRIFDEATLQTVRNQGVPI